MEPDTKTPSTRGKGRGRGRGRKKAVEQEKSHDESTTLSHEGKTSGQETVTLDLDADITQLEAPTFSTINKGPPEPMLRLSWDHKTHLIGEKVINPMIHSCDKCEAPILIYGRMIPCKHVFCLSCAERECKTCPRCQEKIVRIERTGLGTVFMCTFGGTRYGNTGCRRTYLSQRDLLAHINHRHVVGTTQKSSLNCNQTISMPKLVAQVSSRSKQPVSHHAAVVNDPRVQTSSNHDYFYKIHSPSSLSSSSSQQTQRPASHHYSTSHHPIDLNQSTQSNSHNVQNSTTTQTQQPAPRHLPVSSSQQIIPSPGEFVNQMIVPNYPPPAANSAASIPNARSNLITIQTLDANPDSGNSGTISIPPNFPHTAFSPQFTPTSSPNIPCPVPPPSQLGLTGLSQTSPQYFPSAPINYALASSQRPPVTQFNSNSSGPSILNQSSMIPRPPPPPTMVPPPRRTQFPRENVIQPFPVGPGHRWHQPNQPHFF